MMVTGGTFIDIRGDYYQVQNGSPSPRKPYVYYSAFFTLFLLGDFFLNYVVRSVTKIHLI